jgi:hypothetical protein
VNDVQATGPDSAYLTNSNYLRAHPLLAVLELLLSLRFTDVIHCTSVTSSPNCRSVDNGLNSPNGVAMSYDGRLVELLTWLCIFCS